MRSRVVVCALLVSLGGCSFFLKGVPKDHKEPAESDCQPFILVPIVDAILGAAMTAWAVGDLCRDSAVNCVLGLGAGGAIIGASVWGYLKVRKCEKAMDSFTASQRGGDRSIDGLGPEAWSRPAAPTPGSVAGPAPPADPSW